MSKLSELNPGFSPTAHDNALGILLNQIKNPVPIEAKEFVTESTHQLKAKIYLGWQEIFQDVNRFKFDLQLLSVSDKFAPMNLNLENDEELLDEIMNAMIKCYSLN